MYSKYGSYVVALSITVAAWIFIQSHSPEPLILRQLTSPAPLNSAEPNLALDADGTVYLTWQARLNSDTTALQFATLDKGDRWSASQHIAAGSDWFVNWADFPALAVHNNGTMAAHYLKKSGGSPYAYDVKMTTSVDGGTSWSHAFLLHRDGTQTEHGFASILPWQDHLFFATWLDGRNTGGGHDGHGGGAMTLRAAFFDVDRQLMEETELDNRICDCCQTTAVDVGDGTIIIAYRDRSEQEIRDISSVRYKDGVWSSPRSVHADQWEIAGCPVNGPAMDAANGTVAIAWFTASNGTPRVLAAFSTDQGHTFSAPVQIDSGRPLGRVDVTSLPDATALVSWLEQTEHGAEVRVRRIAAKSDAQSVASTHQTIAQSDPARRSGFPKMIYSNDRIVFAWTELLEGRATQVQTAFYDANALQNALSMP